MKTKLTIALLLGVTLTLSAQNAPLSQGESVEQLRIFEEMQPNVTVHQSDNINKLLISRVLGIEQESTTVSRGFRIQFFSSNDQQTAANESSKVAEQLRSLDLGYEVYRTYHAPFWRVRVGNFQTQEEANEVMDELLEVVRAQKPELLENGGVYPTHDDEVVLTNKQ